MTPTTVPVGRDVDGPNFRYRESHGQAVCRLSDEAARHRLLLAHSTSHAGDTSFISQLDSQLFSVFRMPMSSSDRSSDTRLIDVRPI